MNYSFLFIRLLRLVPLLDLANHSEQGPAAGAARADPILHTGDGMIVLCATKDLRAGDEVCFAYRDDITDAELLLDYGFADGVQRGMAFPV